LPRHADPTESTKSLTKCFNSPENNVCCYVIAIVSARRIPNQSKNGFSHPIRSSTGAQEIEQEIDEKVWNLDVEKSDTSEFMATLVVREPMISISTGDIVSYKVSRENSRSEVHRLNFSSTPLKRSSWNKLRK